MKEKVGCRIVSENLKSVKVVAIEKGILGSVKVCFNKVPPRWERERVTKCLKNNKVKYVWANTCVLIK